jgi:hypothetical protein
MNARYGVLPSAPPAYAPLPANFQQTECILCHIPYSYTMVFPCNCRLIVHENCAQVIRKAVSFHCPSCRQSYMFPLDTPGTSVMDETVYEPRVMTRVECVRHKNLLYTCICCLLLIVLISVGVYVYLTYFK